MMLERRHACSGLDLEDRPGFGHPVWEIGVLQFRGDLGEGVRDRNLLRAFFEAGAASNALGGVPRTAVHQVAAHPQGVPELAGFDVAEHVEPVEIGRAHV